LHWIGYQKINLVTGGVDKYFMKILLITIAIILIWIIFVRIINYYKKINSIKIIGFRIKDNYPCIFIKYHTNIDNVIIIFKVNEQINSNDSSTKQAEKGKIKLYIPTTVRPSCRLYFALITLDGDILAQDNKIFGWGWKK